MPIPIITGSPGVYIREEDVSQQDIPTTTSIAAEVFGSRKGTLSPVLKTSGTGFTKEYGNSDVSWGYGHVSALAYFSTQNNNNTSPPALWSLRVVNTDARHAGATVLNLGTGIVGDTANEILGYINPGTGTANGYSSGGRQLYLIKFAITLATGATFGGTITPNGGSPVTITPVTFSGSAAATMAAIVASLNTALGTIAPVGNDVTGVAQVVLGDATRNQILLYGPEGNTITMSLTFSGQVGNSVTSALANNLIDVFAENPGAWASNVGVSISNINAGIKQRTQLNFSGPLITGNSVQIALLVNSNIVTVPATVFSGTNDATLTALAAAIQTAIPNSVVTATIPAGSVGASARQINIIAPTSGPGVINLFSAVITSGASQAIISFAETLAGVVSNGSFNFNIWQRGNILNPIESYNVTLVEQLDGFGQQMFIEERVNTAAGHSQNVRVRVNAAAIAAGAGIDAAYASYFNTIVWLNGGADGSLPTNSQINAGWQTFADNETYRVNLLINAGYTDASVQQTMSIIAQNRQDCMAILDLPSNVQDVNSALTYRTTQMNINTSYAAVYSPDVQIVDQSNDRKIYVPPSGYVASRYVYTDNNFATWWAPAGVIRGALPGIVGLRQTYKKPDRDILDPIQINCLRLAKDGSGFVIWGDNTTQVAPSLLSAINVRRLMLYIENTIAASLERNVFDNNSSQLAFLVQRRINKFLGIVQNGEGIKKFLVLANSSNNPAYFADAGQFNISVYVVPIRAAKTILLDAIVTPDSISFNELIINGIF